MPELRFRKKSGEEGVEHKVDNVLYNPKDNTITVTKANARSKVLDLNTEYDRVDSLNDMGRVVASYGAGRDSTFPANVRTVAPIGQGLPRTTLVDEVKPEEPLPHKRPAKSKTSTPTPNPPTSDNPSAA